MYITRVHIGMTEGVSVCLTCTGKQGRLIWPTILQPYWEDEMNELNDKQEKEIVKGL